MNISVHPHAGNHTVDSATIVVTGKDFNIIFRINPRGAVEVQNATDVSATMPFKVQPDGNIALDPNSRDHVTIKAGLVGMEGGPELSMTAQTLMQRPVHVITSIGKGTPVLKVRDGSGCWKHENVLEWAQEERQ